MDQSDLQYELEVAAEAFEVAMEGLTPNSNIMHLLLAPVSVRQGPRGESFRGAMMKAKIAAIEFVRARSTLTTFFAVNNLPFTENYPEVYQGNWDDTYLTFALVLLRDRLDA
jgi:hypothetical protein